MRFAPIFLLSLGLVLGGCAGYRLGPTNGEKAGAKSVQVTPFINNSPEPGLADEVTAAVRKAVQSDGTYHLATHGDSDLIVTGVITRYDRRQLTLLGDDLRTVRDYQIAIAAQVTIRERSSNRVLAERTLNGDTLLRVSNDFGSSERQVSPQLAKDLARQVKDLLVDGSW